MTRRGGFTLLEVMAVIFLTALVFGVAIDFYIDLSDQSHRASENTREIRRAISLLDRIAGDFERTLLAKKPEELDPLAHPWVFLGESRRGEGSDRVKFITRRATDARSAEVEADISTVAYELTADEVNGDNMLIRWSQPNLPDGLDREFPSPSDPRARMMADGVVDFAVYFLDAEGEWVDEWDSSQMLDSSELPTAVEIRVALAPLNPDDPDAAIHTYRRQVLLPVRPLDFTTLLDPKAYASLDGGGEGEDGECRLKVSDCIDFAAFAAGQSPDVTQNQDLSGLLSLTPEERQAVRGLNGANLGQACWDDFREAYGNHPAVRPECR
jgi:type II secretion system protein J